MFSIDSATNFSYIGAISKAMPMTETFYTDIKKIIPHREPMMIIDRYKRIDADSAVATACFCPEAYGCRNGWVSEMMLIEAAAQTAAAHIGYQTVQDGDKKAGIGMLATVDDFTWHGRLKDTCEVEILIFKTDEIGPFKLVRAQIQIGGKTVAEGRIKLFNPPPGDAK